LVSPGDAIAFSQRLEQLVDHPQLREAMGRSGRDHVKRQYDIDRLNDRLVQIYQGLLAA
jgi:colanic acid/amylovoran biosynthesis glycosyltransferase